MKKKIIIGTRGSILAIAQAHKVRDMLKKVNKNIEVEIKKIVTSGDKDQRTNWGDSSLKSLFVKEIEKELLDGDIDIAVHSMKDMPQISPTGLMNGCYPAKEDNRDVLVSNGNIKLSDLTVGARIGTSSLRREKGILNLRDDIKIVPIRGNIHTRLKKLKEDNTYDAIVLAAAGLKRVGLENEITQYFEPEDLMPAPAQGILCVQCRENDEDILEELKKIGNEKSRVICKAEREFSRIFDGGCHTPMGCSAKLDEDKIIMKGMYYHEEKLYFGESSGSINDPVTVAKELAEIIKKKIK